MEALRSTINSDDLENVLYIPEKLKHRRVEIIILPADNEDVKSNGNELNKIIGKINNISLDPLKFQKEIRDEW